MRDKVEMPKLLTYTGFYTSPYFMRWEFWYKSKLVAWMTLELVHEIGEHQAFGVFWEMIFKPVAEEDRRAAELFAQMFHEFIRPIVDYKGS